MEETVRGDLKAGACVASASALLLGIVLAVVPTARPAAALSAKEATVIQLPESSDANTVKSLKDDDVLVAIDNDTFYTYNGREVSIRVRIVAEDPISVVKMLEKGADYSVSYQQMYYRGNKLRVLKSMRSAPKKPGYYRIVVKGMGKYTGTIRSSFEIHPSGGYYIKKLKAGKRSFTIIWKKQPVQTTGYAISYSTKSWYDKNAKFKHVFVRGKNKTGATVRKLKSGKTYYVLLGSYKSVMGNKIMGDSIYGDTVRVK